VLVVERSAGVEGDAGLGLGDTGELHTFEDSAHETAGEEALAATDGQIVDRGDGSAMPDIEGRIAVFLMKVEGVAGQTAVAVAGRQGIGAVVEGVRVGITAGKVQTVEALADLRLEGVVITAGDGPPDRAIRRPGYSPTDR
jgi:hypothetical protein